MKKIRDIAIFLCTFYIFTSCNKQTEIAPNLLDIRQVSNLAVLECYYHNLVELKNASGLKQWIDYESKVKLGIDVSLVEIKVNNTKITVSIPSAQIIGESVIMIPSIDVLTEQPGFFEGFFKAPITNENQITAVSEAKRNCKETIQENQLLMRNAQTRAMKIIENYVQQISEMSGKQYHIEWNFIK